MLADSCSPFKTLGRYCLLCEAFPDPLGESSSCWLLALVCSTHRSSLVGLYHGSLTSVSSPLDWALWTAGTKASSSLCAAHVALLLAEKGLQSAC